ncbi:MAG: oligosaccharide flippase family protein, partial [Muribaculaceae bacterium]|nr:oligosaccharide flippase family protein [Muribaculaceae bacterium]
VIIGLNILTGLLYTPYMLRCLGQNEYGLYSLVASVITYLTLLDFGFGSAIVRYTARIRAVGTKAQEWNLYGMFATAYVAIGILAGIGGVALYANVDRLFDSTMNAADMQQARVMMALMAGNLALTFPLSIFGSIVTAYERFIFARSLSILRILLSTAVLIAVLALGFKAIALVVVQTIFSLGTLLLNMWYCLCRLKIKITFGHFDMALLKEIIVFSWWNFLGAIVDRIYWGTGQFVLGAVSGTVAVAIFSLAISLQSMYMSMSISLSSVLLPRLTSMVARNEDQSAISNLFIRTGRLQFAVLAMILAGFIVFGHAFITLWAGSDYDESYYVALIFF